MQNYYHNNQLKRMYDPMLGRTPTIDPLAEKYYSTSPYDWCASNPIRNIDPDGAEWIISSTTDKNGAVHVRIKVTGVVYNNSSECFNMYAFRNTVSKQIEKVFTFSDDSESFDVVTTADIRVANSIDDISEKDHIFQIVDQSTLDEGWLASTSGLNIRIGSETANASMAGKNTRTISHELGHSGGLRDANIINEDGVKLTSNLMTQVSALQKRKVSQPETVTALTPKQIRRIIEKHHKNNAESAVSYKYVSLSTKTIHSLFGIRLIRFNRQKVLKK